MNHSKCLVNYVCELRLCLKSLNWRIANWVFTLTVFKTLCEFCFLSCVNWWIVNHDQSLVTFVFELSHCLKSKIWGIVNWVFTLTVLHSFSEFCILSCVNLRIVNHDQNLSLICLWIKSLSEIYELANCKLGFHFDSFSNSLWILFLILCELVNCESWSKLRPIFLWIKSLSEIYELANGELGFHFDNF